MVDFPSLETRAMTSPYAHPKAATIDVGQRRLLPSACERSGDLPYASISTPPEAGDRRAGCPAGSCLSRTRVAELLPARAMPYPWIGGSYVRVKLTKN